MHRITAARPKLVGQLNERHLLRLLQSQGPLSRAEIARRTGLSPPTVSKAAAALLAAGLLEESGVTGTKRGRPAPALRLASDRVQVLGVVVDAGHCEVVSAGLDGVIHPAQATFATPPTYAALVSAAATECKKRMARPGVRTLGVAVSLPGQIDYRNGAGVLSPNVPITDGHTPAADLGTKLNVPGVLVQETHALCLAERHYGSAVGRDDFAVLDVGVGVGLAVMLGGRLIKGHSGLAGELGHVTAVADGGRPCGCGNTGCLETVCSDAALADRVGRKLGRPVSVDEVIELVRTGRAPIAKEVQETAKYLAIAVAAAINLYNPQTVFVHSQLFDADPGLFARVVEMAKARALPPSFADCQVERARGSKRQGAVAAAVQHLTNAVVPGAEGL